MPHRRVRLSVTVFVGVLAATCFQFGGCFSTATQYVANFNPCGTVLDCDPITYRFYASGYEGPGVDPDVDPFCTYPPFCGRENDPLSP